jgi:succinate-acetate transporter protein
MAEENSVKLANPAPVGLAGFAFTTVLLSLVKIGVLPAGGEMVVIPSALAYGGMVQLIAGSMEFKTGNTFGFVAFMSYGGFWIWYALLVILGTNGIIDLGAVGPTIGVALILWGVFTFYLFIGTLVLNKTLVFIFGTLVPAFVLLGLGGIYESTALTVIGGLFALACGLAAWYLSAAEVINHVNGRTVVPVGPLNAKPAAASVKASAAS